MIRVALYLVLVGLLAYGAALLADRPGDVVITWQGWRIETSLMVLGAALLAATAILVLVWSLLSTLLRSPFMLRSALHQRRGVRAYEAISQGLIAIGAGDLRRVQRFTAEVKRIAPAEPLALLLTAQAAQLAGDRAAADRAFRVMARRADTKSIGLHGLFIEAQRRDDVTGARAYAEEAARTNPSLDWAGRAVLEFHCVAGDWVGALALLERSKDTLDKDSYRRRRAVMLTARALAAEEGGRDSAKAFALEAVKLAPTLVPAAALAGRFLAEGGDLRKAGRIVEKAWRANPHPDLAQTYADLRFGDTARDRFKRVERLAKKTPGQVEAALALARGALDAQEFGAARAALAPHLAAPTKRIALLMAAIERAERSDEGRAREWMARALSAAPDPAWTADGYVSACWLPVSPVSGRLDAFEWRVPLAGMANATPMIESAILSVLTVTNIPSQEEKAGEEIETASQSPPRRRIQRTQRKPDPVIPLVHAPDDPGTVTVDETESKTEPQAGGWRRMFE